MKARELKNITVPIKLSNRTFYMAFDFNALAELEEVYGDFDKAMRAVESGKGRLKAIRALIYSSIKPRYRKITELEIGNLLTDIINDESKAEYIINQMMKAIELAMPNNEDNKSEKVEGE